MKISSTQEVFIVNEKQKETVKLIKLSKEEIKTPQQDSSFVNRATCQRRS